MTTNALSFSVVATMLRGAAVAICALHPHFAESTCERFGALVDDVAAERKESPALLVGLVSHESKFKANAANKLSSARGWGQILLSTRPACRAGLTTAACLDEEQRLFDPSYNLRAVASSLKAWRDKCRKITGKRQSAASIVAGYAGNSDPKRGRWCLWQRTRHGWKPARQSEAVAEVMALVRKAERAMQRDQRRRST